MNFFLTKLFFSFCWKYFERNYLFVIEKLSKYMIYFFGFQKLSNLIFS